MLNMRGCFATLSSSRGATQGEARECWPRPGEMLPAACREEGGVQRSQRFSEERQMKADGAKSQSSIPQPSLGDYSSLPLMLNVVWLSAFVSLANIIQDRAFLQWTERRRPGVCLSQLWRVLWCKQSSAAPCLQVDRWWCGDDGHYECQSSVMRNEERSLDTVILL